MAVANFKPCLQTYNKSQVKFVSKSQIGMKGFSRTKFLSLKPSTLERKSHPKRTNRECQEEQQKRVWTNGHVVNIAPAPCVEATILAAGDPGSNPAPSSLILHVIPPSLCFLSISTNLSIKGKKAPKKCTFKNRKSEKCIVYNV